MLIIIFFGVETKTCCKTFCQVCEIRTNYRIYSWEHKLWLPSKLVDIISCNYWTNWYLTFCVIKADILRHPRDQIAIKKKAWMHIFITKCNFVRTPISQLLAFPVTVPSHNSTVVYRRHIIPTYVRWIFT